MENHSTSQIIGSPDAPYVNQLASECGRTTNYHNITHPSLPNYMGATSGMSLAALANKFPKDCLPGRGCLTTVPSIFGQGETWKAYEEDMPANCSKVDSGNYATRHNPPAYYSNLASCTSNDVPYSALASDLSGNTLPAFSFVTPNLIDDMHSGTVAQGDTWLSNNLPAIFNSVAYTTGTVAVFVTWDEGGKPAGTNNCPTNTTDFGCQVVTIVASPTTKPGKTSGALYNHWSLLRSTEELLGLPLLGKASTAHSMVSTFGL